MILRARLSVLCYEIAVMKVSNLFFMVVKGLCLACQVPMENLFVL